MKNINKYLSIVPLAILVIGLSNCTKHDQTLDLTPPAADVTPVLNTSVLNSASGTATLQPIGGAAWDGTIEGAWNNASKLTVNAVVPDDGNATFAGWVGYSTDITLRSLHDANYIYFLAEFNTPQKNVKTAQWYFDPTKTDMTLRWAQESGNPTLNTDGSYRPPFAQDQFTFMFNINNSSTTFTAQSCYAACHKNTSFSGTAATGGYMGTNGPTEVVDCWRARMLQAVAMNQVNDCFIDDGTGAYPSTSGTINKNQVHSDWQALNGPASSVPPAIRSTGILVSSPNATAVFAADGGFTNKQALKISLPGGGFVTPTKKANVPIWVIPSGVYTNGAIYANDTLSVTGAARKVVAVDSFGVITLSDASTIDPRVGTDYQRVGSGVGAKSVSGSFVAPYTAGKGDVICNAYYDNATSTWRMLFKRKLSTGDVYDADFSALKDTPFGVGVMLMGANFQHAIVAGLTLHFQ